MVDGLLHFCGLPIRVKIEEGFCRVVHAMDVLPSCGIFEIIVATICFCIPINDVGLYFRYIRFLMFTARVLPEFFPHIAVLMVSFSCF